MKKIITMLAVIATAMLVNAKMGFTYQGVLLNEDGTHVSDNPSRSITFRIYNEFSGGKALWERKISVNVSTDTGLFSVELSDDAGTGNEDVKLRDVFSEQSGKQLYLALEVDGSSGEIWPRQKLLPVPYAMHAEDAAGSSADRFVVAGTVVAQEVEAKTVNVADTINAKNVSVSGEFLGDGVIPRGGIIMWSGSTDKIPEGWVLCNGQNGTPDLRDKFIIGAGSRYAAGKWGGAETVTLSPDHLPPHTHNMTFTTAGYTAVYNDSKEVLSCGRNNGTHVGTSTPVGSGAAFSILPPYYSLAYIMRKHKDSN